MDDKLSALRMELFPEEYDFIYDSGSDSYNRRHGINPMSVEYQETVNKRRLEMGVQPFVVERVTSRMPDRNMESHLPLENATLITSFEYCRRYLLAHT
jgi:hypothetical protein